MSFNHGNGRTRSSTHSAGQDDFVQIIDVAKRFGDVMAVRQVNLNVRRNELFALLGSSGCGKSTLLRMLAGFETVTAGKIILDGEELTDVPAYRRPVNMMFQSYALFPHMTVEANVAFGLKQEGTPRNEIQERVYAALEQVQMTAYARRKPGQLSGGQQQRVALARSLVKRPKLLLLDEPMSALDKQIRQKTQIELVRIIEEVGVTCIVVTHDQEEAMTMADRLAVMSDGLIQQCGSPQEVYEHPATRFVAGFIGSTNLFEGRIIEDEPDHVTVEVDTLPRPLVVNHGVGESLGMEVAASVRPEKIVVTRTPPARLENWARGTVAHVAYLGSRSVYQVRLESGQIIEASVPSLALIDENMAALHDEVYVGWGADAVTLLRE